MRPEPGGAVASDGDGASSCRVLIIGFGNTLRRDDGVGVRAAELLAADPRLAGRQVEIRAAYQLLPEMALEMGAVSLVIFVDADLRGLPGSIEVRPIVADAPRSDVDARAEPGASSHHVGGGELVALAAALTGHRPEAVSVGIGLVDTELGEGLSPAVEAALPRVVNIVVDLVERHQPRELNA
jgi:hydrogenase maturation protease